MVGVRWLIGPTGTGRTATKAVTQMQDDESGAPDRNFPRDESRLVCETASSTKTGGDVVSKHPLPEIGFLRIRQILGDPKAGTPAIYPVCRATWYAGIKAGHYPRGVRIGGRAVAWRVEDIKRLIAETGRESS